MKFYVYIDNKMIGAVCGCEAAGEAWDNAWKLAEALGMEAALIDGETGEIIDTFNIED